MRRVCLVDCDYGLKLAPNPWPCINTKGGSHRLRPPCLYVCLLCYHSTVPPLLWFVRPVKWPISKQIHSPIRTHHAHWDLIYRARVIDTSNRSKISHLNNHIIRPLLSMVVADRATRLEQQQQQQQLQQKPIDIIHNATQRKRVQGQKLNDCNLQGLEN